MCFISESAGDSVFCCRAALVQFHVGILTRSHIVRLSGVVLTCMYGTVLFDTETRRGKCISTIAEFINLAQLSRPVNFGLVVDCDEGGDECR